MLIRIYQCIRAVCSEYVVQQSESLRYTSCGDNCERGCAAWQESTQVTLVYAGQLAKFLQCIT